MKNLLFAICAIALLCSCSATRSLSLRVLEPAPVSLPAYIKNVGVANRSLTTQQGRVADVVDKIFSLEGANLDKAGSEASVSGLSDELAKDSRFTSVQPVDDAELNNPIPGLFPSPLSWDAVGRICRENNTDALFVLELFDTDSRISYEADPVKVHTPLGQLPVLQHQVHMLTTVNTGWRIYDPSQKTILDEFPVASEISYSARGINPVAAANALIGRKDAVREVGSKAGQSYASRITPHWFRVSREYFVRGTASFAIARRKAETGNWQGAGELWLKETENTKGKVAGRACYNMAIISEINGDIDKAVQWAQQAYEDYNNRLALRYVRILENRKLNDALLEDQQKVYSTVPSDAARRAVQ